MVVINLMPRYHKPVMRLEEVITAAYCNKQYRYKTFLNTRSVLHLPRFMKEKTPTNKASKGNR